jgi:23S rRNA G2445 N2-methylase RlmL
LLPGVKEFFASIPAGDKIILASSRKPEFREATLGFLKENGIRFDDAIFGLPYGERIEINDSKASGLITSLALSPKRDEGLVNFSIQIDTNK